MKKQLFLLFSFISFCSYSQEIKYNLNGSWIKYFSEMKDGSKLYDRFQEDSTYIKFTFKNKNLCMDYEPLSKENQNCIPYTLENNLIKTSNISGFIIEKIEKDTLILSEKINGLPSSKSKRLYFLNENYIVSKKIIENNGVKNLKASKNYTPKLSSSIISPMFKAFDRNPKNLKLKANLVIFPNEKRISTTVFYSTKADSTALKTIKKTIDESFNLWDLSGFENYQSIEIPFVLKSVNSSSFKGIKIEFFTNSFLQLDIVQGGTMQDMMKSSQAFQKALDAYDAKKYSKAIEYFTDAYEYDVKNLDALYNRASSYYQAGDLENACRDWEELKNIGQVKGKELFDYYCNKTK